MKMVMMIHLLNTDEVIYCRADEYYRTLEPLNYLGIEHTDYIVEDKIYCITWYDYIDEDWKDIWCYENEYEEQMNIIREAEVEYEIEEFN